jgi:hypothetical protein
MAITFRALEDTTPFNTAIEHVVPASFQIQPGSAAPSSDHWNDAFFRPSTMLYVKT